MNARKRFLKTLQFDHPDKVPFEPGGGRESTLARWHREGLPETVTNVTEYAYRCAGGKQEWPQGGAGFPVQERMIPQFEEKVIERRANSQVVQDWKGNICEIGLEFTVEHLRTAKDFVTRRWIKCPVETRADWEAMKRRYDPDDPARPVSDPGPRASMLWAFRFPVRSGNCASGWDLNNYAFCSMTIPAGFERWWPSGKRMWRACWKTLAGSFSLILCTCRKTWRIRSTP